MGRIVWIIKLASCKCPDFAVAGNQMEVNMPILILKKSVVEVIWTKGLSQSSRSYAYLLVQIDPLILQNLADDFGVTTQYQEALTQ